MFGKTKMKIETAHDGTKIYKGLHHPAFKMMNEMRKNLFLCDVVLKSNQSVDKTSGVPAHKVVLASCSPYFEAMFRNLEEPDHPSIELAEIDLSTLEILVNFVYTAEVHINEQNVEFLLPAANFFQLTGLRDACCDFFQAQMDPSNCLGIRSFAHIHDCPELAEIADLYTRENFGEVVAEDEFLELSSHQLVDLISSDCLMVSSEEKVYESVMSWIHANVKCRQHELVGLMEHVRLPLIPEKYLLDHVKQDKIFMEDVRCRTFLNYALAFQSSGYAKIEEIISFQSRRQAIPRRSPRNAVLAINDGEGADDLRSIVYFDLNSGKWYSVSKFRTPKRNSGVAVLGRKLYLIGGAEGIISRSNRWAEQSVDVYDVDTDEWTAGPQMLTRRYDHGVAVIDDCIYAVGGHDGIDVLETAEVYNLATQEWQEIAPMSRMRKGVALGVVNGLLYALGGYDNRVRDVIAEIECYDPKKNKWRSVPAMPNEKSRVGVGVLDGILYVVGGWNGLTAVRTVEAYNPITNEWKKVAKMKNGRQNPGIVISNGLLYAVGGEFLDQEEIFPFTDINLRTSIERYSPESDTWTIVFEDSFVDCYESFVGVAALQMPINNHNHILKVASDGTKDCNNQVMISI